VVRPDVTIMAVVDGVHLAAETVLAIWLAVRDRLCLVTDAVAAAGLRDPDRCLVAGRAATVADGAVRLADGTLAGSVLTLDRGVRNLVDLGVPVAEAVHAATAAPARLLGATELGTLREGGAADSAVLDDRLEVTRTLVGGGEVFAAA